MSPIDALQLSGAIMESLQEPHDVGFHREPSSFVETWAQAIRTRGAVWIHSSNSSLGFLFGERGNQGRTKSSRSAGIYLSDIKTPGSIIRFAQQTGVMSHQGGHFGCLCDMPRAVHVNDLDVVPAHPLGGACMKEAGVGISLFDFPEFTPLLSVSGTLLNKQGEVILT